MFKPPTPAPIPLAMFEIITYHGSMNNSAQPDRPIDLPAPEYYHRVHTLIRGLPPPVAGTPEALAARNQAAIERVAALLPIGANEAELATQCVATRAQAEDVMRLLRKHDGDIKVVIQLNAQYVSMTRTSLSAYGHLLRAQALRHKREASNEARDADEWARHVAQRQMQQVLDAGPVPAALAPDALAPDAPAPAPAAAPPPVPAATPVQPTREPLVIKLTPPRSGKGGTEPRDLLAEAEHYAIIHPLRVINMRCCGGLPPDCDYGPPDHDLLHAIVTGNTPILRAYDVVNEDEDAAD